MKLTKLSLRGLLRFTDRVDLDFTGMPEGLIAITGDNGSGKTALLEAPLAALYRQFPSREKGLVDYVSGPTKGMVEASFELAPGEPPLTAQIWVHAKNRQSEALLTQGGKELNDGKVSTYDAWVAEQLPSLSVLLASAFSAQDRRGSFAKLDRAGRKSLFSELLGLERYDTMAQAARTAAQALTSRLDASTAKEEALVELDEGQTVSGLQRALEEQEALEARGIQQRDRLQQALADARSQVVELEATCRERRAAAERRGALKGDIAADEGELEAAEAAMRAQEERSTQQLDAERAVFEESTAAHRADMERHQALLTRKEEVTAGVKAAAAHADALRLATQKLAAAEGEVKTFTERAHKQELARVQRRQRIDQLADLKRRAGNVTTVPCGGTGTYAGCHYLQDAQEAVAQLLPLEAQVMEEANQDEVDQVVIASLLGARAYLKDCREAFKSHDATDWSHAYADAAALDAAEANREAAERGIQNAQARWDTYTKDWEATKQKEAQLFDAKLHRIEEAMAAHHRELDALADAETIPPVDSLLAAREAEIAADSALYVAMQAVGTACARVETLKNDMHKFIKRSKEIKRLRDLASADRAEVADWQFLATALGRTGLPIFEIDAAGPTVSAICNDLLQASFGGRFSVALTTQTEKKTKGKDGSTMKEVFTIDITDAERPGTIRDLTDLSGGEQIIVDEALKAALAVFCNRQSDHPIRTCWRDETTGPLDAENSDRYISMLRRLLTLGDFSHILYITHSADAAALADTHIHVANGGVQVV